MNPDAHDDANRKLQGEQVDKILETDPSQLLQRLAPDHIRLYRWGATQTFFTVEEAATALDITEGAVNTAIAALEEFHLVDQAHGSVNLQGLGNYGPSWRVVHPHLAAARMASTESQLRRRLSN